MADNTALTDERIPTVIADGVDIVYRINGTGSGRGSATAALNRILRPGQAQKAAGTRMVHAVKNVSFVAYKGEAVGLIGTNGSGKSTLLKAVAGLLPVERGKIYTDGQPSLLGVNAALMGDLTGERNVYLGGLAMGMTREQIKERYQEIVDFSGINEKGDFISLPMRTYSSGMGSRLRFSIAAAKDHDVLLIDEALATGDAKFQARSAQRIREMREHAGTVFLVSHSLAAIRDTCERTLWLERGELRMDGPTEDVLKEYEEFTGGKKKPAAAKPKPTAA
ncbi:ABC transporter ATP-binding protein [Streptomyces longwoodensis]|uniref:ABC transporter ATP-binding protein n=1 Tax=Streptomyces lasalocidi TaxID=324833 RepID=A0A4V6AVT5_STRLS|nr:MULTISPECIES: ABC transporter ATP-binding protein [Streptomyces]MCX4994033.1 ABC transporter ATP-binding protein [Streptomyces longwoodensis]TKT01093.1 ABC transporter ATP-binding protein [Streptomyces lasalocidi]WRY88972.1 ABC transporter ATP-binding protein [Streptomyces longwoodensis]WTI46769.1 ABC transporter ATP-binding protein [Streptomyces longwoodensis]WUC59544.1 ABC transporter ATP-binding protein [Streptomyces longwoodensis]